MGWPFPRGGAAQTNQNGMGGFGLGVTKRVHTAQRPPSGGRGGNMGISRRAFIQTTIAGGVVSAFGFDVAPLQAQAKTLKISHTSETRSTCPYCSVSCGVIIQTLGDKAKNAVPQVVH